MPLSVKDGMGAWIKDFQDSNAPQFKGKSDKERREMAMAAYLSAKRGDKNEEVKPPFDPDPPKQAPKNSDGSKTSPMSRAKQLAKMARDRNMKKESVELDEMFASTTEPHKDGHRPKVVKTQPNGKTTMSYLGQHVYKSKEHARNAADHIAKGMRKGRASDSYIQDFARRHHKEHGMKESVEASMKESNDGYYAYQKAKAKYHKDNPGSNFDRAPEHHKQKYIHPEMQKRGYKKVGSTWVKESVELDEAHAYAKAAKALHDYGTKNGGIDKKDFHAAAKHLDNVGKAGLMQKGTHLAKFNNHIKGLDTDVRDRIHMTLKQHGVMESVQEAGSPERYKMIKKAGDKYNKEKKKAERDAMKAMSKDKDMMGESDVSELKKSTLGSYVNKASKDAASKAYGAASAAKDNRADQSGKDFAKSLKRLRGINTATSKLTKESTLLDIDHTDPDFKGLLKKHNVKHKVVRTHDTGYSDIKLHGHPDDIKKVKKTMNYEESVKEAKSFDQKFKDHLKFATSKSPAVQNYLAKRKADRDAMNKKNDPNAAKKGYALTAVPPERKYQKLQKAKKAGKA